MICTLCSLELGTKNLAVFDSGHSFHLTCVFAHKFKTTCSTCQHDTSLMPDFGVDREIAISSDLEARIKRRQLMPETTLSYPQKLAQMLSPLTPKARTFSDHLNHNKKLRSLKTTAFLHWTPFKNAFLGLKFICAICPPTF